MWIALCSNMKSAIFGRLRAVSGFLVHIVAFPGEKASAWWGRCYSMLDLEPI